MGFFNRQRWGRTLLLAAAIMAVLMGCGGEDNTISNETRQPAEHTLDININPTGGGTVSRNPDKSAYNAGEQVTVRAVPASGYSFVSWSGVSTSTNAEIIVTMEADLTLTANFQRIDGPVTPPDTAAKKTYTVTFDATGGSVTPTSGTTNTNGNLTTLPTPTRTGYTFIGWYSASTGGTSVTTTTEFTASITIYAHWTSNTPSNTYTVVFNANGGSGAPASVTTDTDGKLASLPTTVPTRSGYTFNGWYTASIGGTKIEAGQTFTANTTVYAQWTQTSGGGGSLETVSLGGVKWMTKNLNVETADSWCYGEGGQVYVGDIDGDVDGELVTLTPSQIQVNCNTYGRLYTWEAAKTACQSVGMRLPTRREWDILLDIAGAGQKTEHYWPGAGKALKADHGWYNNGNGTDTYGFSALPGGGGRNPNGYFGYAGYIGYWWTATENDDGCYAYSRDMSYGHDYVYENHDDKGNAYSVRCLQD